MFVYRKETKKETSYLLFVTLSNLLNVSYTCWWLCVSQCKLCSCKLFWFNCLLDSSVPKYQTRSTLVPSGNTRESSTVCCHMIWSHLFTSLVWKLSVVWRSLRVFYLENSISIRDPIPSQRHLGTSDDAASRDCWSIQSLALHGPETHRAPQRFATAVSRWMLGTRALFKKDYFTDNILFCTFLLMEIQADMMPNGSFRNLNQTDGFFLTNSSGNETHSETHGSAILRSEEHTSELQSR